MIQRSAVDEDLVAEVVARVTSVLRPWRIVLFGSRARGTHGAESDYDFYVELDDTDENSLRTARDAIHTVLSSPGVSVDLKVAARATLERRRDDPGTIEWDVAREGRVVYSDPRAYSDIAPANRVRERVPGNPESLEDWLEVADRDRRHRDELRKLPDDWSPEICWLSQQSAEKHLKAVLVSRWIRPKRTHKLTDLLDDLNRSGLALAELRADCELLSKHAVDPRYTVGKVSPTDARLATDAADRVIAAVRAHLSGAWRVAYALPRSVLMNRLAHDVRFALRGFRRTPGFTAAAVAILALGIGMASAIAAVSDAVLRGPLPVEAPERVVTLWPTRQDVEISLLPADLEQLQQESRTMRAIAGFVHWGAHPFALMDGDRPLVLPQARVTGNFFEVLGTRPVLACTSQASAWT